LPFAVRAPSALLAITQAPRALSGLKGNIGEGEGEALEVRAEVPPAVGPMLLNRTLQLQDQPYRVWGWIENSFTGDANGMPANRSTYPVEPNHLANSWMGNQYYFIIENPVNQVDTVNFGFRFDTLFGNDWEFTKSYGLFDRAFPPNHFAGLDFPQMFGEVHLPILTPLGLDVKGGRFYSVLGFESPMATARPLLSVPYSLNFTPFTFFGMMATLHLHERLNFFSGTINGFDRWIDHSYHWGYLGALSWISPDRKLIFTVGGACVPDQLPRFAPADNPLVPVGTPPPGFLAGLPNPFYARSWRGYIHASLSYQWTSKLQEVFETCQVWDPQILGFGHDPYVPHSAAYHSFIHWFLYQFNDRVTGVWRTEIFWDPYGLATGIADTFHEMTLGLQIRPHPWLWIRPEARYDWGQFTHPFSDGTRKSQLTLSFDVVVLF
jgi:hypothetical protein